MPCAICGKVHDAATPCTPAPAPLDVTPIADAIRDGFSALGQSGPERVPAPRISVQEEPLYRFNGSVSGTGYDFSSDLFTMHYSGEAKQRVDAFIRETFAVATGDVDELNPTRHRPDMYVDKLDYDTPLWDTIKKGSINDKTAFDFPQFGTASGFVADHTEGTEPTSASFTSGANTTVQPTPISGKVVVNREVVDAGGNPQVSQLLYREFTRAWSEALEAYAFDLLDDATPTAITLTAGAADDVLAGEIEATLAAMHFLRGGTRMRDLFVNQALHKALVDAKDGQGRKLYPILAPQNATGTTSSGFGNLNIGGYVARPAWILPTSTTAERSSYLFCRDDVWGWASPMQRIDMPNIAVATVSYGIWGYKAGVITRLDGVREIKYDPAA